MLVYFEERVEGQGGEDLERVGRLVSAAAAEFRRGSG